LYNDDPTKRLSREETTSWQELHKSRETAAEISTKPNDQDIMRLTKCYAEAMEIAIDDAKNMRMTTGGSVNLLHRSHFKHYHDSDIETLIALDAPDEIDRVSGQSLYSNKILTEHIVKRDLSRKDTIEALAGTHAQSIKRC
jgi:hypothetical protein